MLALAAGQATALTSNASDAALEGVARGAAAAQEVESHQEERRAGLENALAAIDDILLKREGKPGKGPEHAKQVLEALLEGSSPAFVTENPGLTKLANAYGKLKLKADKGRPESPGKSGESNGNAGDQGQDED